MYVWVCVREWVYVSERERERVQGIVIQAGKPTVKATAIMLQCALNSPTQTPNTEALNPTARPQSPQPKHQTLNTLNPKHKHKALKL